MLDQAVTDLLTHSNKRDDILAREEARVWLRGNTRDFYDVCHLACLDPADVKKLINEILDGDIDILHEGNRQ